MIDMTSPFTAVELKSITLISGQKINAIPLAPIATPSATSGLGHCRATTDRMIKVIAEAVEKTTATNPVVR